jgi:hypothetical protein
MTSSVDDVFNIRTTSSQKLLSLLLVVVETAAVVAVQEAAGYRTTDDSVSFGQISTLELASRRYHESLQLARALGGLGLLDKHNGTVCYIVETFSRHTKLATPIVPNGANWTHHVTDISLRFTELRSASDHHKQSNVVSTSPVESLCIQAVYHHYSSLPASTTPTLTLTLTSDAEGQPSDDNDEVTVRTTDDGRGQEHNSNMTSSLQSSASATGDEGHVTKRKQKGDESPGLNRRQILVISTCSTVIGLFSIVALILRLRNYMKRSKQDKEGTRRHVRSLTAIPPRTHHHSSLDNFNTGHDGRHDRRWSQFNPFSTDR